MAKCVFAAIAAAATVLVGGCRTGEVAVSGGPVAPEFNSSEKSQSGDPSLPFMKPWWRD